jgi:YVTN family beta-propeller protein
MLTGCGDVYRPVANPVLKPGGDPAATRVALVLSNNAGAPGVGTSVDISGDTNIGNFSIGRGPVHAAFVPGSGEVFVANKDGDNLSSFFPLSQGSTVNTVTLPVGSAPVYLASTEGTFMYVANSGTNSVGAISIIQSVQQVAIPVGRQPVALVQTPDRSVLYSVNQGDGTVTVISPAQLAAVATIPVGASPVAAAVNSDGKTLYIANQGGGTVSVIDVASSSVTATVPAGPSPKFMIFDPHLRRLYVANTGSNTISVFSADTGLTLLANVTVGAGPASIAPLPDGTRIYVANAGCADAVNLTGCSGNTVSVVDAVSLTVRRTITVGATPISLAADPTSVKVVVANRDSNTISSIRTSDDTVVATIAAGATQPVWVTISP